MTFIFNSKFFKTYILLFLVVSSHCLDFKEKSLEKFHADRLKKKIKDGEIETIDQELATYEKTVEETLTVEMPEVEEKITNKIRSNAISVSKVKDTKENIVNRERSKAVWSRPSYEFKAYIEIEADTSIVDFLSNTFKHAEIKALYEENKSKNLDENDLKLFFKHFLNKKFGFRISPNNKGYMTTSLLPFSFEKIVENLIESSTEKTEDMIHLKLVSASMKEFYAQFTTTQKAWLGLYIAKFLVTKIAKSFLKGLITKLLEGTISLAIPGIGVCLLLYKLYKSVEVTLKEDNLIQEMMRLIMKIELGSIAGFGTVKAGIELMFKSSVVAYFYKKWKKLIGYFSEKFKALKNYIENKVKKIVEIAKKFFKSKTNESLDNNNYYNHLENEINSDISQAEELIQISTDNANNQGGAFDVEIEVKTQQFSWDSILECVPSVSFFTDD